MILYELEKERERERERERREGCEGLNHVVKPDTRRLTKRWMWSDHSFDPLSDKNW